MKLETPFIGSGYASGEGFDAIPAGNYQASIKDCTVKTTKKGDGQYIMVAFAITGPSHQGRIVFNNFNIRNPNPKAEEIGCQQLASLTRALNLPRVTDTDELLGCQCEITVTKKLDVERGEVNEVKGYKAMGTVPTLAPSGFPSPTVQAPPVQATMEEVAPKPAAPPWARK